MGNLWKLNGNIFLDLTDFYSHTNLQVKLHTRIISEISEKNIIFHIDIFIKFLINLNSLNYQFFH